MKLRKSPSALAGSADKHGGRALRNRLSVKIASGLIMNQRNKTRF